MWPARSGSEALRCFLAGVLPPGKRHVLLCSFNCRIVADAVQAAGSHVETFDLDGPTGRIDWERIAGLLAPRHGAVIVPHLFGVPADFRPLRAAAARAGVLIIEDCAHTLGGTLGAQAAGTVGDAAIFSFNYDKPISLGGGGLLLVNEPRLWSHVKLDTPSLTVEREARELEVFLQYLRRRRDTRSAARDGWLGLEGALRRTSTRLGLTSFYTRRSLAGSLFPVSGFGPLRAALGRWQLRAYPNVVRQRNANACYFESRTGRTWHESPGVGAAWLKQKAIPPRSGDSGRLSAALRRQGLPVGTVNWSIPIDQYLGGSGKPNASHVSRHSLDVPIHQNMTRDELDAICAAFSEDAVPAVASR